MATVIEIRLYRRRQKPRHFECRIEALGGENTKLPRMSNQVEKGHRFGNHEMSAITGAVVVGEPPRPRRRNLDRSNGLHPGGRR